MATTLTQNYYQGAGTVFNGHSVGAMEAELADVNTRIDGIRTRMRSGLDLVGLLFLGLCVIGVVVMAALAFAGFTGGDAGIGMLFSALIIIFLPLVGFSAVRAIAPIARLRRELTLLRSRGEELRRQVDAATAPAYSPPEPGLDPPVVRPVSGTDDRGSTVETRPARTTTVPSATAPSWWSPTGRARVTVKRGVQEPLPVPPRMLGWGAILLIGLFMALFAIGIIAGVLTRAS